MTWPPPMSPALRRMLTSPITRRRTDMPADVRAEVMANLESGRGDPRRSQLWVDAAEIRDEVIIACIREGFDDDTIVMLLREHPATQACYRAEDGAEPIKLETALPDIVKRLRAETAPPTEDDFVALDELLAASPSDADWVLAPLIQRGESVSIVGAAKVGKSLLALDAVASKAAELPFLDVQSPVGPVLYYDFENNVNALHRRLVAMGYGPGELPGLHYAPMSSFEPLDTPAGAARILRAVEAKQAALVVIDGTQRVLSGDEDSSTGIRELYRLLIAPLRASGVSVLRLDNTGKVAQRGARGTSAKADDVDEAFLLTKYGSGLRLDRTHSRSGMGPTRLEMQRKADPLHHVLVASEVDQHGPEGTDERATVDSQDQRIAALMLALDKTGLPPKTGRPTAEAALKNAGIPYRTDELAVAVRRRKALES